MPDNHFIYTKLIRPSLIAIILLFISTANVYPQKPDLKFTYLTREQGLCNSSVLSIFQDKKGYMWFGTEDGLNRYDGYNFISYKNIPGMDYSLSNNFINQVTEDKNNRTWVATNYGLNIYDNSTHRFARYMKTPGKTSSISSNIILCIYQDSKNNMWIGTASGLNIFNAQTQSFKQFHNVNKLSEGSKSNIVNCIYEEKNGNLWIGTDGAGIQVFDPLSGAFSPLKLPGKDSINLATSRISSIKKDYTGNIWIGTTGNGLVSYNPSKNILISFKQQKSDLSGLSNNVIKSILCDHKNNIWIGTENGGINLWQSKTGKFIHYKNDPEKPSSLSQKTASCLFEDNQNNLWVGTHRGGINFYAPNAYKFNNYTQGSWPGALSYKDIKTFFQDKKGDIWIGTDGGGINIWNKETHNFRQYRYNPANNRSVGSDAILHITEDHLGNIWVGTWGGGLNLFNSRTGGFTRFLHDPKNNNSISSNNVWRIYEDSKGNMWIATSYGGLNLFNRQTKKFTRISSSPDGRTHLTGNNILTIQEDHAGNLWFSTNDGGLSCLTYDRKKFVNYFNSSQKDLTDAVHTLFLDSKHRLWAGKTGLYLYDDQLKTFKLFLSDSDVANEKIQAITEDNKGYLWISTNNGLIQFNPDTHFIKKFSESDGLQGLEFCQNACLKTRSGELLFGGFQGFNMFNPDSIITNNYKYPLQITDILLFNRSITTGNWAKQLEKANDEPVKLHVNYDQSVLSLEYAALNYATKAKTKYAYKLTGFDKGWNYVGTQRKATYTNLNPGDYVFYVKASSVGGLWDSAIKSLKITVTPPFWMTWWFKILFILIVSGVAFLVLYYRRKSELQKFHEEKQEEIHQLQLQFFTNISHEFRTPLTLILGVVEQILKQGSGFVLTRQYNTLQRNAARLIQLISELMDFRKAESGALKLKVMAGNFSLFLQEIAEDFKEQALLANIEFNVKTNDEHKLLWFDRQIIEKILLNLIINAFKYTPNGGKIDLEVLPSITDYKPLYKNFIKVGHQYKGSKYIYISITDNGPGISKDSFNLLFERYYRINENNPGSGIGLAFVKSLTLLHKGCIYLYSKEQKGTQIIVAIPCTDADYAKADIWSENHEEIGVQLESVQFKESFQEADHILISKNLAQKEAANKQCILIVDDNEEVRTFLKEILDMDYLIIEADNGKAGLLKAKNESPALIISDVMMPVMNGIEFCKQIKEDFETSHIPFILLTAKDALESKLQGIESGADYYFSKPLSTDLLTLTIKNLFRQEKNIKERYLKEYKFGVRELVHSSKDKSFMDQLVSLLEQKIEDPELNVEFICREIGISKSNLYKKIKNITGQSINEFIRTTRLKKSMEIMTHEDVLVTEVMYRVGILSQSYFTSIFKKEVGMTPSQFQQQLDPKQRVTNTRKHIN